VPDVDPQSWLEAIRQAVETLPYGLAIFLVAVGIGAIRWGLIPLINAIFRR